MAQIEQSIFKLRPSLHVPSYFIQMPTEKNDNKKKMKRSRSKTALPQKHEKPTLEMVLQHVPEARVADYIETPSAACLSLVALGMKLTAIETLPDTRIVEGASGTCGQLPKSSFFFDALRALVFEVARRLSIADVGEFSYTSNAPWEPDNINVHWRSPNVYNVFFNSEGRRENLSFSKDGGSFEPLPSIVPEGRPFRELLRSLDLLLATKFLPGCGRLRQEGRLQINGRSLAGATLCTTLRELSRSDSGVRIYAKPFKMAAARAASRDLSEGGGSFRHAPPAETQPQKSPSPQRLEKRRRYENIHMSMAEAESKKAQKKWADEQHRKHLEDERTDFRNERAALGRTFETV
jgi:hypothetical protein